MSINAYILTVIIGCALVTMIPRVVPFLVVRNISLPEPVLKWLSYVPVCILTALVVKDCMIQSNDSLTLNWQVTVVLVPTLLIALKTKSLSMTVISGVVLMAGLRLWV
ncbi:AzlD domain-containing protein [Bacillus mojavensis]|jgi:branched-subunit amino acid transport protein|uniref:AzlD domain-containing protein n=1 Tax=Bacillus TaxID=1386 RepID=UPI00256F3FFA|nr:AzlD domain-containing protein [Bacillus mojavensis]MEC1621622.1 AzlD domain-containing protein [Bacillus mojavensis]MEC1627104.1 AzlD domain-containing protein [Bacillus mojavensis]MEC1661220.1 AzlD domain-containing protein [Bacillus mojavensis]MEC1671292.1 AzlD domain-containing protein [Bacillus mojavensis]MEC1734327.1 AzlD domain-containing protein [Bacillus mojavensis]